MSDLHARLRGVIEERLALARAAEGRTGEWEAWHIQEDDLPERFLVIQTGLPVYRMASVETPDRSRFIAAHDPADAIRRHEAALDLLGVLQSWHHDPDCQMGRHELGGETCAHFDKRWRHECALVVLDSLAASYGVPVESVASDD